MHTVTMQTLNFQRGVVHVMHYSKLESFNPSISVEEVEISCNLDKFHIHSSALITMLLHVTANSRLDSNPDRLQQSHVLFSFITPDFCAIF